MLLPSKGLTSLETFETDLFPLAAICDDVDICVRRDAAAATAAEDRLPELFRMVAAREEPRLFLLVKLARRVQLDHVIAAAVRAPELFFVQDRHCDLDDMRRH